MDLAYCKELLAGWEQDVKGARESVDASLDSLMRDMAFLRRVEDQAVTLRTQVAEMERLASLGVSA